MADRRVIDGATLLGTSLTLFALRGMSGQINWQYWIMVGASLFFLGYSVKVFFEKHPEQQKTTQ